MALGTPRYMSPEQILGDRIEGASDVYSLVCVLYEMLAGEAPFGGPTAQAVLTQHTLERAPSLRKRRPEVGRALDEAVRAALAKNPANRPSAAPDGAGVRRSLPRGAGGSAGPVREGRGLTGCCSQETVSIGLDRRPGNPATGRL